MRRGPSAHMEGSVSLQEEFSQLHGPASLPRPVRPQTPEPKNTEKREQLTQSHCDGPRRVDRHTDTEPKETALRDPPGPRGGLGDFANGRAPTARRLRSAHPPRVNARRSAVARGPGCTRQNGLTNGDDSVQEPEDGRMGRGGPCLAGRRRWLAQASPRGAPRTPGPPTEQSRMQGRRPTPFRCHGP